jgi:2-polyprenyl-6-methoxyphenol hydroxylase-like FAD-dependent oxidoreductase
MTGNGAPPRAVVVGAGIGGLAAAASLSAAGWRVTVFERAGSVEPAGAGLALAPNGLRALDAIGIGAVLRAHAVPQAMGMRRPDGRWLLRATTETMVADRFGDPIIMAARATLIEALLTRVPDGALRLSTEVTSVSPDGTVVTSAGEEVRADLVVAADGIGSAIRSALWAAEKPRLRYAGFTTWRLLTGPFPADEGPVQMAETWGRGKLFGVMPLADGRVYCYAAAVAAPGAPVSAEIADELEPGSYPPGAADLGEQGELMRVFSTWHEPILFLVQLVSPAAVLRHDVAELAAPLRSFHQGRVALLGDAAHPMTPNLGQGACQAIEDAVVLARLVAGSGNDAASVGQALTAYTAQRLPRTTQVVRWSRRMGAMSTWQAPAAVAFRDQLAAVMGKIAPAAALRGLAPIYDWRPPAP